MIHNYNKDLIFFSFSMNFYKLDINVSLVVLTENSAETEVDVLIVIAAGGHRNYSVNRLMIIY